MFAPVRIAAPASNPVSVAELKTHARIDHADEDTMLAGLLDGAVAHLDGYTGILGRCIVEQTWRQDFQGWYGDMLLPFPDVSSVTVRYRDEVGAEVDVEPSAYELTNRIGGPRLELRHDYARPTLQDATSPVSVELVAGFAEVPWSIKVAIMMLAAHWYDHREAVAEHSAKPVPLGFDSLIAPYRHVRM